MDRIILTDECDAEYVQTVIRDCPDAEIFFVDPEGSNLASYYSERVQSYAARDSFAVARILREAEYEAAKALSARYAIIFGNRDVYENEGNYTKWKNDEWNNNAPYYKESNIIAADYHIIREKIVNDELNNSAVIDSLIEKLCVLEHIRWCRFYYLNGWKYAEEEVIGGRKDDEKRLHPDLKRFDDLPKEEQTKDLEVVASMFAETVMRKSYSSPGHNNFIDDQQRYKLIESMALKEYGAAAEEYCKQHIGCESSPAKIAITGFDIAGIAYMVKSKELLDKSQCESQFHLQGFEKELLDLSKAHSECNVDAEYVDKIKHAHIKHDPYDLSISLKDRHQ